MRNTPIGDVRPTSPLSARTVEIASEIGSAFHTLCGLRAREGRGEPLTSARTIEIASEIGGVVLCSARAAGARGRGAHRREQTDPPQPPVRRADRAARAGCRRFHGGFHGGHSVRGGRWRSGRSLDEPRRAPAVAEFVLFTISIGAADGARAIDRTRMRPRRG